MYENFHFSNSQECQEKSKRLTMVVSKNNMGNSN